MITGYRWHPQGARAYYGLDPDLVTFGKAMGNGYSVSALVGRRELMERGGLRTGEPRVFLLSLTHGAEPTGLAAARAVVDVYRRHDVIGHLWSVGEGLAEGLREVAGSHGVSEHVQPIGLPCNLVYTTRDQDGQPSQPFRTLLLQELLRRGVLAPSLVVSWSHNEAVVEQTLAAFDGALAVYRDALDGGVERFLVGRPVQPVFRRFVGGGSPLLHDHVVQPVHLVADELVGEVEPEPEVDHVRQGGRQLGRRRHGARLRVLTVEMPPGAGRQGRRQRDPLARRQRLEGERDVERVLGARDHDPQRGDDGPGVYEHPEPDRPGARPVAVEGGGRDRVLPAGALVGH